MEKSKEEILKKELQKENFTKVLVEETSQARPNRLINGNYVVIKAMQEYADQETSKLREDLELCRKSLADITANSIIEIDTLKEENKRLREELGVNKFTEQDMLKWSGYYYKRETARPDLTQMDIWREWKQLNNH
jgi:hypothetical protein